jgi:squalene-associated FAD-dependent desaturase
VSGRGGNAAASTSRPRVAVVGAGLAGLAAGLELSRSGCSVTLFERSRLLGGKATSFRVGDREVDNGQHVILGCCTEFLRFTAELGMSDALRIQDRFEVLMLGEDRAARLRALPLPAPLHLAVPFMRFGALSWRDRLAVALALLAARRADPEAEAAETFAAWLSRHHQGAAARRAFWEPFIVPALNAPLAAVSAASGLFVVRTAFLGDAGAARIGWSTVPLARFAERAAADLDEVRLRTAVTGLVLDGGLVTAVETAEGELPVDGAVLAVPPERLRRMAGVEAALGLGDLSHFRTEPIVDVHLFYEWERGEQAKPGAPTASGGSTRTPTKDEGAGRLDFSFAALLGSPVQWVFAKGPGYVCCSLSSAGRWIGEAEERLVAMADTELRARIPALAGATLVRGAATRDPEATLVPSPGLRRPRPATRLRNLTLAGAWIDTGWPATMEGAVRSGRTAARTLLPVLATTSGRSQDAVLVHA